MKKEPFVSIVICTHNRAEALNDLAFKSILKLDYSNYEVVIVDDASTDNTKEIVERYQDKINNLKYIKNNKSKGLCYVRNLGVENSKGEIIAFIDDDCYVDKNWLKEIVKPYLKDKEIMVVGGRSYIRDTKRLYNPKNKIYGCNMSFRKKIFDKFLFDNWLYFNKSSLGDETELIDRIKNKDLKTFSTEKAIVKHFIMPAKYRANIMLGCHLNGIYRHKKKMSIIKYYFTFLKYFFLTYKNLYGKLEKIDYNFYVTNRLIFSFLKFIPIIKRLLKNKRDYRKYYKIWIKIPYIYYLILLEIPIKAKIKNWLEEKKFYSNL